MTTVITKNEVEKNIIQVITDRLDCNINRMAAGILHNPKLNMNANTKYAIFDSGQYSISLTIKIPGTSNTSANTIIVASNGMETVISRNTSRNSKNQVNINIILGKIAINLRLRIWIFK